MCQQNVASLALARHLKRSRPDLFILLGGANCEGVMGPELVRRILDGEPAGSRLNSTLWRTRTAP
ncbi:hypothetical protein SBA6_970012 [Candidatus Sulfopaludibacter sp. SbA6]|nr:hypothetical protein SBA6_970012 [Candidatus Sulfopaludibacter sp. SbA6]HXP62247.1 hypothetical protein [Dongiaceae bacterium]